MGTIPNPLAALLLLVPLLVILNGLFAAAETALVKTRTGRLDTLAREGHVRARFARSVVQQLGVFLAVCRLGMVWCSLVLGWVSLPALSGVLERPLGVVGADSGMIRVTAVLLSFLVISALHMTIGELMPRAVSLRHSEAVALWAAAPLLLFHKLTLPFLRPLTALTRRLLRRTGSEPPETEGPSEEDIRHLMKETRNSGRLDPTEMMLVDNIFEFSETSAREIMIPRTEMVCLYAGRPYRENMAIAKGEMLTRYPVCDPDKDRIIGFIHIKDLLKKDSADEDIRPLIRPLLSVPESIPISALLRLMQKNRTHLVLLIDEYGGTSGLVTVEDILEEIVGEIQDEFDEERPVIEIRDGEMSVDGLLHIEELNDKLGLRIGSEDHDTIGGWLSAQVDIPPRRHQSVHRYGYEFTVEEVDRLRISRIAIRPSAGERAGEQGGTVA